MGGAHRGTAAMSEPENETRGFKVTDRRKFTPEGELRTDPEAPSEPASARAGGVEEAVGPSRSALAQHSPAVQEALDDGAIPSQVTFLDLVGMLATNAMLQLGDVPDPASGERVENLRAVQDMISFLDVLKNKTEGHLSRNEGEVLEQVRYDLKMRYMAKAGILNL